ncbi:unnamed protein product, partial [Rotaria sp. Silwood2]
SGKEEPKPADPLPGTQPSQTSSDLNALIVQKERKIEKLTSDCDEQVREITSLKEKVQRQMEQILWQEEELTANKEEVKKYNEEVTKWRETVTQLIESTKTKNLTIETQQQQIQIQQQQIETQQQHMQEQNKRISLLETTIRDQKEQIEKWFQALKDMKQIPKVPPKIASLSAPPDIQNMLQNPPSGTPILPNVPQHSPPNTAPNLEAGAPALISVSQTAGTPPSAGAHLPSTVAGPSSSVTFPAMGQSNGTISTTAHVPDPYDINSYGTYQVTIFDEAQQEILVSTLITVVPDTKICVPKQFVIRDALNNIVVGGRVTLKNGNGTIAFTGVTDSTGTVRISDTLPDDIYDVEINSNNSQLKTLQFKMVVFRGIRPPNSNQFPAPNVPNPNQMKFVLKWDALPADLDSHMFASNGTHVYYQNTAAGTMSLDCDVTSGDGPETITVDFQPNVKYVYVVHR